MLSPALTASERVADPSFFFGAQVLPRPAGGLPRLIAGLGASLTSFAITVRRLGLQVNDDAPFSAFPLLSSDPIPPRSSQSLHLSLAFPPSYTVHDLHLPLLSLSLALSPTPHHDFRPLDLQRLIYGEAGPKNTAIKDGRRFRLIAVWRYNSHIQEPLPPFPIPPPPSTLVGRRFALVAEREGREKRELSHFQCPVYKVLL
ncbi:hypothetical protein BCR35DRAFT_166122 [Leucosporidium creatinivorum]|uniref:Uncharacterized protein n=1 Tax=Leucosporidium creatinivorum TaxID=106004 RepID=A0A1Y2EHN7_9BASI|nr:hypothetical protein BCR35DRAFT_166122 [Leucosporidium creatinivorum]